MKKQHNLYVNNLASDIKANPRDFYRYIKSRERQSIPTLKRRNDSGLAESELAQADELNCQFTDFFKQKLTLTISADEIF